MVFACDETFFMGVFSARRLHFQLVSISDDDRSNTDDHHTRATRTSTESFTLGAEDAAVACAAFTSPDVIDLHGRAEEEDFLDDLLSRR